MKTADAFEPALAADVVVGDIIVYSGHQVPVVNISAPRQQSSRRAVYLHVEFADTVRRCHYWADEAVSRAAAVSYLEKGTHDELRD